MANGFRSSGVIDQIYYRHCIHGQPHFQTSHQEAGYASVHLEHEGGQVYEARWDTLDLQPFVKTRNERPLRAEMDALAGELIVKLGALQNSNPESRVKPFRANALVFLHNWCIVLGGYHLYVRTGEGSFQYLLPPEGSLMTAQQREGFRVHPSIERIARDTRVDRHGTLSFHTPAECVYDFDEANEVVATTVPLHERPEWEAMSRLSMDSAEFAGQVLMALRDDGREQGTDHVLIRLRLGRMKSTKPQETEGKEIIIPAGEGAKQKLDPHSLATGEIRVLWGPQVDEVYWLFASTIIGRSKDCDIAFEGDTISRRHLKIAKTDEGHVLEDLNSTGGVFINDEKKQRHVLKNFDRIQIGSILMEFRKSDLTMVDRHRRRHDKQPIVNALDREVGRISRREETLCLVLFELDHFKQFSEAEGFPAGDAVLAHIEAIGRSVVRPLDTFARIGGEEFGMTLLGMGHQAGMAFAERLRVAIEKSKCFYEGRTLSITISCGVAEWSNEGEAPWSFFRRVDRQLSEAKKGGGNRVC